MGSWVTATGLVLEGHERRSGPIRRRGSCIMQVIHTIAFCFSASQPALLLRLLIKRCYEFRVAFLFLRWCVILVTTTYCCPWWTRNEATLGSPQRSTPSCTALTARLGLHCLFFIILFCVCAGVIRVWWCGGPPLGGWSRWFELGVGAPSEVLLRVLWDGAYVRY